MKGLRSDSVIVEQLLTRRRQEARCDRVQRESKTVEQDFLSKNVPLSYRVKVIIKKINY